MKGFLASFVSILIFVSPLISNAQTIYEKSTIAQQHALAFAIAPVKSADELKHYLKITPKGHVPFNYLSSVDKRIFLNSLTFGEKGLSGFNYAILKEKLNQKQITEVLSVFGAQHLVASVVGDVKSQIAAPTDYKDYKCSIKATCSVSNTEICIGDNC